MLKLPRIAGWFTNGHDMVFSEQHKNITRCSCIDVHFTCADVGFTCVGIKLTRVGIEFTCVDVLFLPAIDVTTAFNQVCHQCDGV